jgi:hypothetical protein
MSNLLQDVWLHLNQAPLRPFPADMLPEPSRQSFASILQYFTENTRTKNINLRAVNEEDAAYLERLGISPGNLIRNLKETLVGRHLDPLDFQLKAVRNKCIQAYCPFSGKPVASNQSLLANINVIFYRFETEQVFYIATAGIGSGFKKSAVYFPDHDLMVSDGDPWGLQQDDLIELKTRMVCGAKACYDYLSNPDRKSRKSAVCLGFYHFAHHLWNELSGLHRLHKKGLLPRVDKFLVLREPLGPIEQIFPEIQKGKVERQDSTGDLFDEILAKGYFVVRVGDDYLASALASRVAKVSLANCLPVTLEMVEEARSKYYPLLWVGIRVRTRAWVDQVEGLSNVIASLQKEFPRLGVVFDGFSLPSDRSADSSDQQGYSQILAEENEIVNGIFEYFRQRQLSVGMFNIIGLSIFDANVWAHNIDVYVSPYGSLQHKVGWFTNKPGIVHTNQTLLENPAAYVWANVENGIPPQYIGSATVTDYESRAKEGTGYNEIEDATESGAGIQAANKRVRENPEFNNYSIQWEGLHNELSALIRSSRTKSAMTPLLLANRLKRTLRMTIRSITNVLSWR